jgi:gamma-glutamyl phosphate reductase
MSKTDTMTPADIRKRAQILRSYADQYDSIAERLETAGVLEIKESGGPTFVSNVVQNLDSNTNRLEGRIKKIESLNRLGKPLSEQVVAAEAKQQYVAEKQPSKRSRKGKTPDK